MLIELDMEPEQRTVFEAFCTANRIEINHVDPVGPGGGCPRYFLTVDTREAFDALGGYYFGK